MDTTAPLGTGPIDPSTVSEPSAADPPGQAGPGHRRSVGTAGGHHQRGGRRSRRPVRGAAPSSGWGLPTRPPRLRPPRWWPTARAPRPGRAPRPPRPAPTSRPLAPELLGQMDPEGALGAQVGPEGREDGRSGVESGPGHGGRTVRLHPTPDRQPQLLVLVPDSDGHRSDPTGMSTGSGRPDAPVAMGRGGSGGGPVRVEVTGEFLPSRPTLTRTGSSSGTRRSTGPGLGYQPLNTGGRRSAKAARPSLQSSVPVTSSWATASSHRAVARSDSRDRLVRYLAAPMALVGAAASRAAHGPGLGQQLVAGDHLVDQAHPLGLAGREVVAEEEQLLGLLGTDEAGQQVGAAGVGGDAPPDEHLDELGLLGRHAPGRRPGPGASPRRPRWR